MCVWLLYACMFLAHINEPIDAHSRTHTHQYTSLLNRSKDDVDIPSQQNASGTVNQARDQGLSIPGTLSMRDKS